MTAWPRAWSRPALSAASLPKLRESESAERAGFACWPRRSRQASHWGSRRRQTDFPALLASDPVEDRRDAVDKESDRRFLVLHRDDNRKQRHENAPLNQLGLELAQRMVGRDVRGAARLAAHLDVLPCEAGYGGMVTETFIFVAEGVGSAVASPSLPIRSPSKDGPAAVNIETATQPRLHQDGLPVWRRYWSAAAIWLAMTMAVLDGAIANVALPTIAHELGATPASRSGSINAYQLTITVPLLPLAALGDRIGYQRRLHPGSWRCSPLGSLGCALVGILAAADRRADFPGHRRRLHHEHQRRARAGDLSGERCWAAASA